MKEIIVGRNEANQRLDKLIIKYLPAAGKGFIYKMIRKKNISLNDKKCEGNEILAAGDSVKLWLSDETIDKFKGYISDEQTDTKTRINVSLPIIYEDDDIVIYNKPAGILSQKKDKKDVSVNEILIQYLLDSGQITYKQLETFRPSICNRLDRNTSGIIICGKSLTGLQEMAQMLKDRTVHKDYIAVVEGEIRSAGTLKGYITKDVINNVVKITDKGDYIETEYKPICTDGNISVIMVRLITGKTHQIRLHMASAGHPLLGDYKYGNGNKASRQMLHAYRVTLPDGRYYTADIPEDMKWVHGNPGAFEDLPSKI